VWNQRKAYEDYTNHICGISQLNMGFPRKPCKKIGAWKAVELAKY